MGVFRGAGLSRQFLGLMIEGFVVEGYPRARVLLPFSANPFLLERLARARGWEAQ